MSKKHPQFIAAKVGKARLFRLWWLVVVTMFGVGLLWSMFPFHLFSDRNEISKEGRKATVSHAAYVQLDPQYAAEAIRKIRSAWATDEQGGKLSFEMELVELEDTPETPWSLEHGAYYPGEWEPAKMVPLEQALPEIKAPYRIASKERDVLPRIPPHLPPRLIYSGTLKAQNFTFVLPSFSPDEPAGSGTFSIETDAEGRVIHLLLLSPRNSVLAQFEQAIFCGTAKGASQGRLTVEWN